MPLREIMSGNGFYKYRCKYFISHECGNWVWVANAPCAECMARGRDSEGAGGPPLPAVSSNDVAAPCFRDGVLQYVVVGGPIDGTVQGQLFCASAGSPHGQH
ncbi:hypothetical protein CDD83_8256 [Cordyceps sp. RAO-2017]|nr:hypothetical protein CDD83_8256 [Cordyceps sp. RAO-2017]